METIKKQEPEAVLRLPDLDTDLIQALAKHWLVTVVQRDDEIIIELYTK